jgi:hypothetical protein
VTDHPCAVLRAYMARVAESGVRPADRLVAAAMATYADKEGHCWPSDRALAEITGLAERSHPAARLRLIKENLLERDERPGRTNLYRVPLDGPQAANQSDAHPASTSAGSSTQPRAGQRGVEPSENDDPASSNAGYPALARAPAPLVDAPTPHQPVRPPRVNQRGHRRDSEGPLEVPKREVPKGRTTRGSDENDADDDAVPMPAGLKDASLTPPKRCQKCHRAVTVSADSGEPLCACTRTEK